jgi:hypothetical protein
MALDLGAIRTALADQINTALAGSGRPANVFAYPPNSPELPAVLIRPRIGTGTYVQYHQSFANTIRGDNALAGIELEIEVRVGGWDIDADIAMDAYLSTGVASSIIDAVETDPTLGGTIESCWIRAVAAPLRLIPEDGVREYTSTRFELEAYERR